MTQQAQPRAARVTVPLLRQMKASGRDGATASRIAMVTAYDATFARMLDEGGADVLLVGDSLGMVVQGLDSTLPVTLDEMIYHCRAVVRGLRAGKDGGRALVVGDMPFMTYQVSADDAVRNAGRFLAEGGVSAVKLEGGAVMAKTIARVVEVGIPVMGHIGLTPQSVHAMGGFKVQGKTESDATRLIADARAVADAGAFSLVLEGIPTELARRITESVDIPTIGIGAGVHCDGQVLVSYDFLGLTPNLRPKFVKRYAELFDEGVRATRAYVDEVKRAAFPTDEHSFGTKPAGEAPPPTPAPSGGTYGPH